MVKRRGMALVLGSLGGAAAGLALVAAMRGNYPAMTLATLALIVISIVKIGSEPRS
jgi:hypothetical protein